MPKVFLNVSFILALVFLASVFNVVPAHASSWVENEHFRARLAAVPEGGNHYAVLVLELEEGWHTYGEDPGDAGLPLRFDWSGSANLKEIEVTWPDPIHKREMDMFDVNAYEGKVSFPLHIKPEETGNAVTLDLNLKIMVCSDICIPDETNLSLKLMSGYRL